jgi:hypothetical protein
MVFGNVTAISISDDVFSTNLDPLGRRKLFEIENNIFQTIEILNAKGTYVAYFSLIALITTVINSSYIYL